MSFTAPTSLLANMMLTTASRSLSREFTSMGLTTPYRSTGNRDHVVTIFFELLSGVNDRVVLDFRDDDVAGLIKCRCDALDCHVVGFGASAGKYDFAGAAVQY